MSHFLSPYTSCISPEGSWTSRFSSSHCSAQPYPYPTPSGRFHILDLPFLCLQFVFYQKDYFLFSILAATVLLNTNKKFSELYQFLHSKSTCWTPLVYFSQWQRYSEDQGFVRVIAGTSDQGRPFSRMMMMFEMRLECWEGVSQVEILGREFWGEETARSKLMRQDQASHVKESLAKG